MAFGRAVKRRAANAVTNRVNLRTISVFNSVMRNHTLLTIALALAIAGEARAQQNLKLPDSSPAASVSQTVGLTEIKISYHRPGVNGRKIWGALVPYGEVWRAGANENTTISFSSPVKLGGKPVAAGTYGLHMIPTAKEWTIILSNVTSAWGSYGYDAKEDALRFAVVAQPGSSFEERLSYRFDNPSENSTLATLRWEKLKVPIKIDVDTPAVVMADLRTQLRGLAQFSPNTWNQAAQYWLDHGGSLEEAQKFVERSIALGETFGNLNTRATIAEKKGDAAGAASLRQKALGLASEADLNQYGYALLGRKKVDEAIGVFQKNVLAHPASWNVHDSLAEAYMAKGDRKAAADSYGKALTLVKDDVNRKRIEQTLSRLKNK
jgi:tetratricopeptide (TPR) repeat protein